MIYIGSAFLKSYIQSFSN